MTFSPWVSGERVSRDSAPQRPCSWDSRQVSRSGRVQVAESARSTSTAGPRLARVTQRSTTSDEERIR